METIDGDGAGMRVKAHAQRRGDRDARDLPCCPASGQVQSHYVLCSAG
jgi:hypothetical protein